MDGEPLDQPPGASSDERGDEAAELGTARAKSGARAAVSRSGLSSTASQDADTVTLVGAAVGQVGSGPRKRRALSEHGADAATSAQTVANAIEVEVELDVPASVPPPRRASIAKLGRYEILGRLATGGMAEVYLAREESAVGTSRQLAIKLVRPREGVTEEFEQMFLEEGRIALRLAHPNICHVYEFGKFERQYFMALEYIRGVTLEQLQMELSSRGERLPYELVVKIAAKVADALQSAHTARDEHGRLSAVVHRDVSPHNIMIGFGGSVKLLDFGIAKAKRKGSSTASGTIKGKFSYVAPEQLKGLDVDGRTDVFSLGVCLWEALTATRLFRRGAEYNTLRAVVEDDAPPLWSMDSDIPPELDDICQKALAKSPADRYATAGQFAQELERFLVEHRHVVSGGDIAGFMAATYPDRVAAEAELDTSAEVIERLSPLVAEPAGKLEVQPPVAAPIPPISTAGTPRRLWLLGLIAVVLLFAVVISFLVAGSGEEMEQAVEESEASTVAEPDESPVVETPDETAVAAPSTLPEASEPEAADETAVDAEEEERSRERDRRRRRRIDMSGLVTDPGF